MSHLFKIFTFLILGVGLTACGGGGGTSDPGPAKESKNPPASPQLELEWGDLECQKEQNCQNPVLNLNQNQLVDFFLVHFSDPLDLGPDSSPEFAVFSCGVKTQEKWSEVFDPKLEMSDEEFEAVSQFLLEMVHNDLCIHRTDLLPAFNNYFLNTKEYLNELP